MCVQLNDDLAEKMVTMQEKNRNMRLQLLESQTLFKEVMEEAREIILASVEGDGHSTDDDRSLLSHGTLASVVSDTAAASGDEGVLEGEDAADEAAGEGEVEAGWSDGDSAAAVEPHRREWFEEAGMADSDAETALVRVEGDAEVGYGSDAGYSSEGGYVTDAGYGSDAGYASEGGYAPDAGYGSEGGYVSEGGYASDAGYGSEGGSLSDGEEQAAYQKAAAEHGVREGLQEKEWQHGPPAVAEEPARGWREDWRHRPEAATEDSAEDAGEADWRWKETRGEASDVDGRERSDGEYEFEYAERAAAGEPRSGSDSERWSEDSVWGSQDDRGGAWSAGEEAAEQEAAPEVVVAGGGAHGKGVVQEEGWRARLARLAEARRAAEAESEGAGGKHAVLAARQESANGARQEAAQQGGRVYGGDGDRERATRDLGEPGARGPAHGETEGRDRTLAADPHRGVQWEGASGGAQPGGGSYEVKSAAERLQVVGGGRAARGDSRRGRGRQGEARELAGRPVAQVSGVDGEKAPTDGAVARPEVSEVLQKVPATEAAGALLEAQVRIEAGLDGDSSGEDVQWLTEQAESLLSVRPFALPAALACERSPAVCADVHGLCTPDVMPRVTPPTPQTKHFNGCLFDSCLVGCDACPAAVCCARRWTLVDFAAARLWVRSSAPVPWSGVSGGCRGVVTVFMLFPLAFWVFLQTSLWCSVCHVVTMRDGGGGAGVRAARD